MTLDDLFRFCDMPILTNTRSSVHSCLKYARASVTKSICFQIIYLICIETALYILFGVITNGFNPIEILETGYPVMLAVSVLFVMVLATSFCRFARSEKRVIISLSERPDTVRLSSVVFVFERETDHKLGNNASGSHIRSLRFSYKNGTSVKYISIGKSQKDFFYDKLIPGGKYRFVLIDRVYLLVVKDN